MKTLEEITYDAGRHALSDQEAFVSGIRQRTGTLLAAHALVASFLGATAIGANGLHLWGWFALSSLVVGLVVAAVLLAPWRLDFAVDARFLYADLFAHQGSADTQSWLVAAGFAYQRMREANAARVRTMSALSAALGVLMVVQTLSWIVEIVG